MEPGTPRLGRWMERRTGFTVALVVVPAFLTAMHMVRIVPRYYPEEQRMRVTMEIPEPAPEPELIVEPEPEPQIEEPPPIVEPEPFEEVAATRIDSQEFGELILDPQEVESTPTEEPYELVQEPVSIRDWIPTVEEADQVREIMEEAKRIAEDINARQRDLQEHIVRAEVVSAARDFELNSDGGLEGAIRLLDVERFPQHIVVEVLERYGITYERRFTSPSAGRSFLNAATTAEGTYRNVHQEGFYEVMTLSAKAVYFMSTRETEALMERGYNPRTTRIRKIVFGIIKENDRYELGVTDLEVERIR